MTNLKASDIKEWPIPTAPKPVQREFVRRISARLNQTSSLREAISKQLDLLVEHRQALITAAVTGELEIPQGVAR
jgi:type I restriction enzyme S subunit